MSAQVIPVSRTVYTESSIHVIECAGCSIDFGIGVGFMARRREDHGTFYCPNGCRNHYPGKSDLERRAERAEAERDAARSLAKRESQRARTADYQRRAAKGQLTKTRKRIAAGVCPCCSRTFQNLARHMSGQHPDYVAEDPS